MQLVEMQCSSHVHSLILIETTDFQILHTRRKGAGPKRLPILLHVVHSGDVSLQQKLEQMLGMPKCIRRNRMCACTHMHSHTHTQSSGTCFDTEWEIMGYERPGLEKEIVK